MESSVQKLLVAIIVTGVILYIALSYFTIPPRDVLQEIEKALDYTEANEGKMLEIEATLMRDFAAKADLLDTETRSVRFECNGIDACTSDKIIVSSRIIHVKKTVNMNIYIRCQKKEVLNDCQVYFGEEPAQLKVELLSLKESVKRGETAILLFKVENIGSLDAVKPEYKLEIMLKNKEGVKENIVVKKTEGTVDYLAPKRTQTITESFEINTAGEYTMKITALGEDSGIDFAEKDFIVLEGVSSNCKATKEERTYLSEGQCKTEYLCEGCEYGFECATRWKEKGINAETGSKEKAFTYSDPDNGECS